MLGPLLFLIFVNDLAITVNQKNLTMFADDTTYLSIGKSIEEVISDSQNTMNILMQWFNNNGLFINLNKTVFMQFQYSTQQRLMSHLVRLHGKTIQQTNSSKFLGVHLQENLCWKGQTNDLCQQLASVAYACYRLRHIIDSKTVLQYYYAQFYSRIVYSIIFWGSTSYFLKIFKLQKKIIRNIFGLSSRQTCKDTFIKKQILTLPCIYIKEISLFFKLNARLLEHCKFDHSYETRNRNDYFIPLHGTSAYEHSPIYSGIKIYNKLPQQIKEIKNYNTFKRKLNVFLINKCYYSVEEYLIK